jgi:hypothetical protein
MQLFELIKAYHQEMCEWPKTPDELIDFCEYKFQIGEIEEEDFSRLIIKLHKQNPAIIH